MTINYIIVAGGVALAVGVFVWGFIRLYFSERESHLKRVIKIASEGDDEHGRQ